MTRQFTGKHVLAIFIAAYVVIISVNLTLAWSAVSTFPGLEVQNSYVASQGFNDRLAAQRELGWQTSVRVEEGELLLTITGPDGQPAEVTEIAATLGRATHVRDDITPAFLRTATGFSAPVTLEPGYWHLRLVAHAADGTEFRQRLSFRHGG